MDHIVTVSILTSITNHKSSLQQLAHVFGLLRISRYFNWRAYTLPLRSSPPTNYINDRNKICDWFDRMRWSVPEHGQIFTIFRTLPVVVVCANLQNPRTTCAWGKRGRCTSQVLTQRNKAVKLKNKNYTMIPVMLALSSLSLLMIQKTRPQKKKNGKTPSFSVANSGVIGFGGRSAWYSTLWLDLLFFNVSWKCLFKAALRDGQDWQYD